MARDGQRLERLQDGLRFFAPEREVLVFPAWTACPTTACRRIPTSSPSGWRRWCVSPNPGRPAPRRASSSPRWAPPCKVPPRSLYAEAAVVLKKGQTVDADWLTKFLSENGYGRFETVMEPGEFAVQAWSILSAWHARAAAARPVRRRAGGDPLVRSHEPALDRRALPMVALARARCC